MERKQIAICIPFLIALTVIHVFLNFYVFPKMEPPNSDFAKHTYEGMSLGFYSLIAYFIAYLTRGGNSSEASNPNDLPARAGNLLAQAIILAIVLFVGVQVIEALVNIFITIFDDLRAEGQISGATAYGMSVIDRTLSGYLFFFGWLPLCIYSVARVTRKLGRNPGYWFYLFVALVVVFGSILTNHQTSTEWSQALTQTLGPIFGAEPENLHTRDVILFATFQAIGALVLSGLLALFMFFISGLRRRIAPRLDKMGI